MKAGREAEHDLGWSVTTQISQINVTYFPSL